MAAVAELLSPACPWDALKAVDSPGVDAVFAGGGNVAAQMHVLLILG